MLKLDHIGIAVEDLPAAIEHYKNIFRIKEYETWTATANENYTAYLTIYEDQEKQKKNISFEIMQPFDEKKEIYFKDNNHGFYHMAFLVEDYDAEFDRLKDILGDAIKAETSPEFDPDYKHAFIEPCEYTNNVRVYIFSKHLDHSVLDDYEYVKCE